LVGKDVLYTLCPVKINCLVPPDQQAALLGVGTENRMAFEIQPSSNSSLLPVPGTKAVAGDITEGRRELGETKSPLSPASRWWRHA